MSRLTAEDVTVTFPRRGAGRFKALDGVSLTVDTGQAVGLIGESGSGKSTMVRVLMGLLRPDAGRVLLDGRDVYAVTVGHGGEARRKVQMIFQDAAGALNPRQTVFAALAEVLKVHGFRRPGREAQEEQARELLAQVGLPGNLLRQLPRELSGGQCQRVCIARALAVRPSILIADEPVSALDVSVQARILRLLAELRRTKGLSLLLVAHDLAVVRAVCDHALVLRSGRVVESGPPALLFSTPRHPYTRRLLAAVPTLKARPA